MSGMKDPNETATTGAGWLTGQMLVAMPGMQDPRFERTVSLICSHGFDGAMAIVINRLYGDLSFTGLLGQFEIKPLPTTEELPIHYGGPVDPVRGFVLHSSDYKREGTTVITPTLSLTATVEILRDIAEGKGPSRTLLALGYAGWVPGQLEMEIQANGWLTAPADEDILFDSAVETKWDRAFAKIGVSPSLLVGDVGHA